MAASAEIAENLKSPVENLNPKQVKALTGLLDGATVQEAAAAAGVTERTLYLWLSAGAFREAYRAARRHAVELAATRLQALTGEAIDALQRALTAEKPADQVRAATAILGMSLKLETEDVAERLAAIEATLRGAASPPLRVLNGGRE
jgi:hypothetical protein